MNKEKLSNNFIKLSRFYWTRPHILTVIVPLLSIVAFFIVKGLITGDIDPVDDIYYNKWFRLALFILMTPSTWFPLIKLLALNLLLVIATFGVTTLIIYIIIKKAFWNMIVPKLYHNGILQGYVIAKINPEGWQVKCHRRCVRAFNRIIGIKTAEPLDDGKVKLYFYRTWKQGIKAFFNPKSMPTFTGSNTCLSKDLETGLYSIKIYGKKYFKANMERTEYTDSDDRIDAPIKDEISNLSKTFDGVGNIVAKGTGLGLMSQPEIMKELMEQQHFYNTEDVRNAEKVFLNEIFDEIIEQMEVENETESKTEN